ncbi:MAG: hypothetical protein HY457_00555 [Parcubacteria group bacterium]|nr:hypothetical protein [Parcubacteria group bacterium]
MGLPEGWNGIFYGPETSGDMLFDLEAQALIDELAKYPKQAPFLVAGAIMDLFIHDPNSAKAVKLIVFASKRWEGKDFPWVLIPFHATVIRVARMLDKDVPNTEHRAVVLFKSYFADVSLEEALQEQAEVQSAKK